MTSDNRVPNLLVEQRRTPVAGVVTFSRTLEPPKAGDLRADGKHPAVTASVSHLLKVSVLPTPIPEVVLVHGAGVSSRYWAPAQEALAVRGFRVHAVDLPGFGRSDDPPWEITLPRLADHLLAWTDAMGLARYHLVGQSVGCEISVLAASVRAEQVASLVLDGPAGLPGLKSLVAQIALAGLDALREPIRLYGAILPDYLRCGPGRLLRTLRAQQECAAEPHLARIECPVLVLAGERDPIVSTKRMAAVLQAIPGSRGQRTPGAHGSHYTHPLPFAEAVAGFIRAPEATPAAGSSFR